MVRRSFCYYQNQGYSSMDIRYTISELNGEPITGIFQEKELQKTSQEKFRIDKVIKRKGDKLYLKRKGYNNSFNSWINRLKEFA